jgi:hypothetical protein
LQGTFYEPVIGVFFFNNTTGLAGRETPLRQWFRSSSETFLQFPILSVDGGSFILLFIHSIHPKESSFVLNKQRPYLASLESQFAK